MDKRVATAESVLSDNTLAVVTIAAENVTRNPDGTWALHFRTRPMNETQHEVLDELFPNTKHVIKRALDTELLLDGLK